MKKNLFRLLLLVLPVLSAVSCKDDADAPLRFYESYYEVPMGGIRYLGLESGNGDYSVEVADQRFASAGTDKGWTGVPGGTTIYVRGILTGTTALQVTDYATGESQTLTIKVTDNYQCLRLHHKEDNKEIAALEGIDCLFLIDNANSREAYLFKQGPQTALTQGLELKAKGTYTSEKEGQDTYLLTLTFQATDSEKASAGTPPTTCRLLLPAIPYVHHRLDKNLHLGWNTPALSPAETKTSPEPPTQYTLTLWDDTQQTTAFSFSNELEMPFGLLP